MAQLVKMLTAQQSQLDEQKRRLDEQQQLNQETSKEMSAEDVELRSRLETLES